jgi:hypothetical protein
MVGWLSDWMVLMVWTLGGRWLSGGWLCTGAWVLRGRFLRRKRTEDAKPSIGQDVGRNGAAGGAAPPRVAARGPPDGRAGLPAGGRLAGGGEALRRGEGLAGGGGDAQVGLVCWLSRTRLHSLALQPSQSISSVAQPSQPPTNHPTKLSRSFHILFISLPTSIYPQVPFLLGGRPARRQGLRRPPRHQGCRLCLGRLDPPRRGRPAAAPPRTRRGCPGGRR